MEQMTFRITIPPNEEGMIGRECPRSECQKYFKVRSGTGIVDENYQVAYCPYCQYEGAPDQFYTKEQIEYAKSIAFRKISDIVHGELKKLERYSFKSGFISMNIEVKRNLPPLIRHYVEKQLQENVICDNCGCEYAIYGIFAICPDCGRSNAHWVLKSNLELIKKQIDLKDKLYNKFGKEYRNDLETILDEKLEVKFMEDACENMVTVFEAFCKEIYTRNKDEAADPSKRRRRNAFQSLDASNDIFLSQFGFDIFDGISTQDVDALYLVFNKRHIITHNLGIIDEKYVQNTGIRGNILRHKVDISKDEIVSSLLCIERIAENIRATFG